MRRKRDERAVEVKSKTVESDERVDHDHEADRWRSRNKVFGCLRAHKIQRPIWFRTYFSAKIDCCRKTLSNAQSHRNEEIVIVHFLIRLSCYFRACN